MSGDVAICTDSSALLPAEDAERLGIDVVPVAVSLDGEPFDERKHGIDAFYERLAAGAVATTSQPSPGDFAAAYERAAARGAREVLSVHLDARVSGTFAAAELAAREASVPVTVLDSRTVSFGVGLCARAAGRAVAAGASAAEAAALARRLGSRLANVFVAAGVPGGRLSQETGWNVLAFEEAATRPIAVAASLDAAVEAMTAEILSGDGEIRAAVGHAGRRVQRASDALADGLAPVRIERYRVGAAVGAHTGPLTFGAFWWPV